MKDTKRKYSGGQALVVLLLYMIIAISLTTTAVAMGISNSLTTTQEEEANHALEVAESGTENAILRLLRDTQYLGETLTVAGGTATVTVSGDDTKTITSVGTIGNFSRTLQVEVTFTDGVLTVTSWSEL